MVCQYLEVILLNTLSTVFGGVLLALFFFFAKEKLFSRPKISGNWNVEIKTTQTEYNPYQGMVLRYIAMLWCEGPRVCGTTEKVYENSSTGIRNYIGNNRTRGQIDGFIEKRYFSKDKVILHIIEDGHGRESTHFHDLTVEKTDLMFGTFSSMVANSEGEATWKRETF